MSVPERYVKMFGGLDKVPDYLKKAFAMRAAALEDNRRQVREAERKQKEEREAKLAKIKSLRRPPSKVWRVGATVFWLPPETADELAPDGYWISEVRNGSWTKHGDYLLPKYRSAQLFGKGEGPAVVECYYHGTALGEAYVSEEIPVPDEDPFLVNKVRYYVSESGRPQVYYERWRRVLAGFGVAQGKRVRMKTILPLSPAMTADEAQSYADRGWGRWVPVAAALKRIEATIRA